MRTLVNNLPECQIEWARNEWGNTNTACVLEALLWARSVLEKIEEGKYDWAHLAFSIWPDRVREKCKHDKSLAIAHDLEHIYIEKKEIILSVYFPFAKCFKILMSNPKRVYSLFTSLDLKLE